MSSFPTIKDGGEQVSDYPHTRPKVKVVRDSYFGYPPCSSHYWVLRAMEPILTEELSKLTLEWYCKVCGRIVKGVIGPPEVKE